MFLFLRNYRLVIFFLSIGLFFLFHLSIINVSPPVHHGWANFDRYALAKGFQRNGFNFYMPETYVMNPLFDNKSGAPLNSSVSSVDFPIHEYVVAIIMDLSGFSGFWVYRLYILLWSFVGLFFLFKLCFLITNDKNKSFFVILLASLSPVYVFYQSGFLPTIPSVTCLIIALFSYWKYTNLNDSKAFIWVLVFLALAALPRTSFIPAVLTIAGFDLILNRKTCVNWNLRIPGYFVVITLLVIYFQYNLHLRNQYGSIFLSSFKGANSFSDFFQTFNQVIINFGTTFFSSWQYVIFIAIAVFSLVNFPFSKFKLLCINKFTLLVILLLFQAFLVFVLMIKQFVYHDYYFLDTFFIPLILLIAISLKNIPEKINNYSTSNILLISLIPCFWLTKVHQTNKYEFNSQDKHWIALKAFEDSEQFLNELGISSNSKVLVIDAYTPNMTLSLMNRKGFSLLTTTHETISKAVQWEYDYVAVANDLFITELYDHYPEFINEFEKIGDNSKISIFKKDQSKRLKSLNEFIDIAKIENKINLSFKIDSVANQDNLINKFGKWNNFILDTISEKGITLVSLNKNLEYGLTYKSNSCPILKEKKCFVHIQAEVKLKEMGEAEIVVSINENKQVISYQAKKLKELCKPSNEWSKIEITFELPKVIHDEYEMAIYFWTRYHLEGSIKKFDVFVL